MEAKKLIEDGTIPKREQDDAAARDIGQGTSDGREEELTRTLAESRISLAKEDSIYASADDENPEDDPAAQETDSVPHVTPRSRPPDEVQQHAAMMDRIRKLERERNSRWQKIMRLLG